MTASDDHATRDALLSRQLEEAHAEIAGLRRRLSEPTPADAPGRGAVDDARRDRDAVLARAFDDSPLIMTISDAASGEYLEVNDTFCRVSEFSRDEIIGRTSIELGWISVDERARMLVEASGRGAVRGVELALRSRSGRPVVCRYWGELIQGAGGDKIFSTAEDITERRRAEERLREREVHLRSVIAATPVILWEIDRQGTILVSEGRALASLGVRPGELVGKSAFDVYEGDLDALALIRRGLAGEEFFADVTVGGTFWRNHYSPLRDARGEVTGLVGTSVDVTAPRRSEEALRQSERRYHAFLEHAADGIFVMDAETGAILEVNDAFARSHGYTVDELLTIGLDGLDRRSEVETPTRLAALLTGESLTFEVEHWRKDGTSFPLEVTARVVESGETKVIVAFHRDITERKRAEDELRTLSRAVEQSPTSIVITDREGAIEYVNPRFEQVTGYTRAEAVGQNPRILQSGATPLPTYQAMWDEITRGGEWRGELCNRRKNGELYWESAAISGLKDEAGRIGHFVAVKEEITERKRVEEALVRNGEVLERVQELARIGSWDLDLDAKTFTVSTEARRIYGFGEEELTLAAVQALVLPEHRAPLDAALAACLAHGTHYDTEFQIRCHSTGEVRDVHSMAEYDPTRRRLVGFIQDVTDRTQAERERGRLQDQLQQAQRMESVGRLAGGVAHDFNNMLGVILGHTELALEQVEQGSALHEDLEEVCKAATRSADLTRQLLAFARKQTVAPKVLDLNATVSGMVKLLKRLIGEDVELRFLPLEPLWPVRVDPSQIDQILANLCVNARDAIASVGTLTIETGDVTLDESFCAAHPGASPGDYVRLVVRDDGCGMDSETLSHIFEPFFTTKAVGKGTGLGLATVYGIVKQNQGCISVDSAPGQGTTFRIHLPRYVARGDGAAEDDAAPRSRTGHETILLVEDERVILRLTKKMLERLGYTVLSASTPGEAVRLAREQEGPIHLLVTDVVMPEMNGRELAQSVAACQPGLRCLFMSGYTADVIADHGVLEEGTHFLPKPFSRESLAAKVREALDEAP